LNAASKLEGASPIRPKVSGSEGTVEDTKSREGKVKPTTATLVEEGNQKSIDFKSVGVRQTQSGNWEVGFRYHGNRRNMGTFATQDQAALANEVGRKVLSLTKNGTKLSGEDIDHNVKLAREAALDAVNKMRDKDEAAPNEDDMLKLLLLSEEVIVDEAENRPNLLSHESGSFQEWLSDRKGKWKQHWQGRKRKQNEDCQEQFAIRKDRKNKRRKEDEKDMTVLTASKNNEFPTSKA